MTSNDNYSKKMMKAKSASKYLGISVRYLHQLRTTGRIPYHVVGPRTALFSVDDLNKFLADTRIGGLDNE